MRKTTLCFRPQMVPKYIYGTASGGKNCILYHFPDPFNERIPTSLSLCLFLSIRIQLLQLKTKLDHGRVDLLLLVLLLIMLYSFQFMLKTVDFILHGIHQAASAWSMAWSCLCLPRFEGMDVMLSFLALIEQSLLFSFYGLQKC